MKLRWFIMYVLPVLLYMAAIFYFSSMSMPPSTGISFRFFDKVEHAFEYFLLSMLLLRMFKHYLAKHPYALSIAVSALYGVSDEVHQFFVPGRVFAVSDMIANAAGASVILAFYLLERKANKKRE